MVWTELLYIFCRKTGFDHAKKAITNFLKGFILAEEALLREEAAKLKCQYTLSLADCYSIALAILTNNPLYMKRESEIETVLKHKKIPASIIFIDDL